METTLDEGYKAMASDALRKARAVECCQGLVIVPDQQSKVMADQIMTADLQLPRIIAKA